MLTLAIETSNPSAATPPDSGQSVAIGIIEHGSARILAHEHVAAPTRADDDLMPAIDRAARAAGITPRQLQRIAVSIGPGGFTALRVAVATAKMIAEVSCARCIAVPSALVAAFAIDPDRAPFAVALATKVDTAFVTVFPRGFRTITNRPFALPIGRVLGAPDFASLAVPLIIADRHFSPALIAAAENSGAHLSLPSFDASNLLRAAALLRDIDPVELLPFYAREPEAITLWRLRHPAQPAREKPPIR